MVSSFELIGISGEERLDLKVVSELLHTELPHAGLDYLYYRTEADTETLAYLGNLSPEEQNKIMLAGAVPPPEPFVWHLKERIREEYAHVSAFSTSIHSLDQWPQLIGKVDRVFYSPVFESISKAGYKPSLSFSRMVEEVRHIRSRYEQLPRLIGLGGVAVSNIRLLKDAGFDGAAVLGSLWSGNPVQNTQRLREALL